MEAEKPLTPSAVSTQESSNACRLEADIAAVVLTVETCVGDTVARGDVVVLLESMKMEIPVLAEEPGVVREVRVDRGESVRAGDVLVVTE